MKPRTEVRALAVLLAVILGVLFGESLRAGEETREQHDARMKWWREARFGMFIHWGVYSVPAGTYNGRRIGGIGEWIMHQGRIPVAEYQKYAQQFNPVKFDAEQWVTTAKEAGQKYIVITSKHHDGFAMFQSTVNSFNIHDAAPFKRDPLKELAAACQKHGIKLGFYYSQAQDWTAPGGAAYRGHWDKAQNGNMDKYLDEKAVPQVKEILTNYGPIAVLWWDTPADMNRQRAEKFLPLLKLQPGIITNDRLGGGFRGDLSTPEQTIPATGFPGRDWETCMTINDTWGYKSYDNNWKPTKILLRNLIDIASKGGNYLLNVGPMSEGLIPQQSVERLREVGRWMKVNGESIYATTANPFKHPPAWGRVTSKPGTLYLHVFDWPADGQLDLRGLDTHIGTAYLLADLQRILKVTADEDGLKIAVGKTAPDPIASVIVLKCIGDMKFVPFFVRQQANGSIALGAADADIHGQTLQLEGDKEKNIGYWTNSKDFLTWSAIVKQPGLFEVTLEYSCNPADAGSELELSVGDQKLSGKVEATGGWNDYRKLSLGKMNLKEAKPLAVKLEVHRKPRGAVMNLRNVVLSPVGKQG